MTNELIAFGGVALLGVIAFAVAWLLNESLRDNKSAPPGSGPMDSSRPGSR